MSPEERFDFHLHTSYSDGEKTPAEALTLAAQCGLVGVSFTDHDTLKAYENLDAPAGGGQRDVSRPRILPGIEISTALDGVELHILGYFPHGFSPGLPRIVDRLGKERLARLLDGLRRLGERGVHLSWEEVLAEAGGGVVSRGTIARLLVRNGYVTSISAAFIDLLGPEMFRPPEADAREIVEDLRRLGAITMWAHPSLEQIEGYLDVLVTAGLSGIELYTIRRRPGERKKMARLIDRRGLLASGGSDWHGQQDEALGYFSVRRTDIQGFLGAIGW